MRYLALSLTVLLEVVLAGSSFDELGVSAADLFVLCTR